MASIIAQFAQYDNDVRTGRTIVGMTAAASNGRWIGHTYLT